MSYTLATQAQRALKDGDFTSARGKCQRFVRQVIQRVHGPTYDRYHKGSAKESAAAWAKSKYALAGGHPTVPGDILYWTSPEHGPYGHVAIRILGNRVAENSTVHFIKTGEGKGTRMLLDLDKPDLVVRLPEPK